MSEYKPIILTTESYIERLRKSYMRDSLAEKKCLANLLGIQIHTGNYLPKKWEQTRYPKSKKKRIRQKFAKKYGKWVEQAHLINPEYLKELNSKIDREFFLESHSVQIPLSTWYGGFYDK